MVHAMAMMGWSMDVDGHGPADETREALIEMGLRVGELEFALDTGDFQFLARGDAYAAIERAHDALVKEGPPRQGMASILRTVLDCGKLCGDLAATMVDDDEE